jgi:hypothetical protein
MSSETVEQAPRQRQGHLPINPETGEKLEPRPQPGYYPGFSTLAQQDFWDEATRDVVLQRVEQVPPIRYFTEQELPLITAIFERLVPQDDRTPDKRVPLVNYVDARLHAHVTDGYRYWNMPHDWDSYRLGLPGIDQIAHHLHGRPFVELEPRQQEEVLVTLRDCKPPAGHDIWQRLPVQRFWFLLLQDAIEAYYAHPYAWDEIGFGGPAYPRGYMRLEKGQPEPWEVEEQRYEWAPPPDAISAHFTPLAGTHPTHAPPGQEGSH